MNKKEDEYRIITLTRVNPNGKYGTYEYQKGLTKEQLDKIEKMLEIDLKCYKFI